MKNNQIEEVKNKTDIVSLISEYIEVKKAGRNYKANCPFHGEKTPSFMITPELQMYKCFGCGRSGDVFTFLEEHEGMEFKEALKYLADKAGIELAFTKQTETSEREKIIEINKNALSFYNYVLNDHPQGKKIIEYLTSERGLTPESIKNFKLGYSPESFDALSKYLVEKKKFKLNDLLKTGNLVGRGIDRFRGRVIFPLFDHRGNAVGFAGRILPWVNQDMAKYINSPDTEAYHKSKVLYGFNITKGDVREKDYVVIVEGELDMISSYQAGIKNVVAIKGSALTEDHLRLIGRFTKKIVLCLDSDFAGNEAAKRGAILAVDMDFEVKVAELVGFKDPDEIARNNVESYKKAIEGAELLWDFLIETTVKKYGLDTGESMKKISNEMMPLISLIKNETMRENYAETLGRKLNVDKTTVLRQLSNLKLPIVENTIDKKTKSVKDRRQLLEEKLLVNAIEDDIKILFDEKIYELISSKIILKIIDFLKENQLPLPPELQTIYAEIVLENSEFEDINLITRELTVLDIKDKLEKLSNEIKINESNSKALKEFSDLSKKLSTL